MTTAPVNPPTPPADAEVFARKKKKTVTRLTPILNIVSMLDLSFNLLIFFILTASFAPGEGVLSVLLPEGTGSGASDSKLPDRPINIVITSSGLEGARIIVEGSAQAPSNFSDLSEILIQMQLDPSRGRNGAYKPDNPVVIKPDGQVRWDHVVNAFNSAVKARYSNVKFAPPSTQG